MFTVHKWFNKMNQLTKILCGPFSNENESGYEETEMFSRYGKQCPTSVWTFFYPFQTYKYFK